MGRDLAAQLCCTIISILPTSFRSKLDSIIFAADRTTDFVELVSVPLTFVPSSGSGTQVCTSITANTDDQVECEEYFTAIVELATPGECISIKRNISVITILDFEGNLHLHNLFVSKS